MTTSKFITKTDFDAKLSNLNRKTTANKTKHLLFENELKKLNTFDSSYFIDKSHFEEDGTQNYLVFRQCTDILNELLVLVMAIAFLTGNLRDCLMKIIHLLLCLTPDLSYYGTKTRVKFTGSCLKQDKITYNHKNVVNIYIAYELGASSSHSDDPTLKNCFFGAVTLTKNADINKSGYFGYGIGFDRRTSFFFPRGRFGQNVLVFGTDMSSSAHIDNRKKDIFVLGKRATQGLEHTLTAEKMYLINFTVTKIKFCLWLHYNRANSYIFVNGTEL